MKALTYRLRGRRNSRKNDDGLGDDVELSFRFEEAVQDDNRHRRSPVDTNGGRAAADDYWGKNRSNHKKAGSCKALAALTSPAQSSADVVSSFLSDSLPQSEQLKLKPQRRTASAPSMTRGESPQQQQRRSARAHSNSRVNDNSNVAAALRSNNRPTHGMADLSSSSMHSQSSDGSTGRWRHGVSISSNTTFSSVSSQKPEAAVDVRFSGILMIKRGPLKMADKRYFFVACSNPELYSCKDETSFNLWLASGHSLRGEDAVTRASGLIPVVVGTVLRADAASEEDPYHPEKTFQVMVGSASKCFTLRFAAESSGKARQWLKALQEVQLTKHHGNPHSSTLSSRSSMETSTSVKSSCYGSVADTRLLLPLDEHNALYGAGAAIISDKLTSEQGEKYGTDMEDMVREAIDATSGGRESVVTRSVSNAKLPRVYTGGKLQSMPRSADEDDATAISTPSSHTGSSPTSTVSEHGNYSVPATLKASPASAHSLSTSRTCRMDSVVSRSSTASGQSQGSTSGNVLLFVPVAGSSLTASASRMAIAQKELDALIAKGAKLPSRVMQDPANAEAVEWRYGVPEYVLTDLAYVKGRLREPDTTPLASYVEECCQTFIMEATHKACYDQWRSVCQESFYLQVNDGVCVPGGSILENDMFGLLYLGNAEAIVRAGYGKSNESQDIRAELAEAFPDGFPMEVLDVFTQPPRCYFSWRHWGPFTGKYRGVKGDGAKVEIRGFGEMTVDASRIRCLRLFFQQRDLLFGLQQATGRVTRARRDTTVTSSLSPKDGDSGRTMRAASAAVAPVTRKGSLTNPKTSEIIEGLADFTIKAKELHRKQTG